MGTFRRVLLLGQTGDGRVFAASGSTDERGKPLEKPTTSGTRATRDRTPVRRTPKTLRVGDVSIECEFLDYGHYLDLSGMPTDETATVLKGHPSLVLERTLVRTDSFRGETHRRKSHQSLKAVGTLKKFGRRIRVFTSELTYQVDGRIHRRDELVQSPEVPKLLVSRTYTSYDDEGKTKSAKQIELISLGRAVKEAKAHIAQRSRHPPREKPSLGSEIGQANLALLREMGFTDSQAAKVIAYQLPGQDFFDQLVQLSEKIKHTWRAYSKRQSEENRDLLFDAMDFPHWTGFGFTEPQIEAALLAVVKSADPRVRARALAKLAQLVPARHMRTAEDAMIRDKVLDVEGLTCLARNRFGNPRRVLESLDIEMKELPAELLTFAPDERAVAALIERFKEADRWKRGAILEVLMVFDHQEARMLFKSLAQELNQDDMVLGKTERSPYVRQVFEATSVLGLEGAPELFSRWLKWCTDAIPSQDEQKVLMQKTMVVFLTAAILRMRDEKLFAELVRTSQERGAEGMVWLLVCLRNDPALARNAPINPAMMEQLRKTGIDTGFVSAKELEDPLLQLVHYVPTRENLQYLLDKCFTNYSADLDLKELAATSSRSWYLRRKGLQAFKPETTTKRTEIICNALPSFGAEGVKILVHLYDWPAFRPKVLAALRRVKDKDNASVRNLLHTAELELARDTGRRHAREEIDFELALTLWCYGDVRRREEIEGILRQTVTARRSSQAYNSLRYLPRAELVSLVRRRHALRIDRWGRLRLAEALSYHPSRECGRLMLELWDEEGDRKRAPRFAECFNQLAGRNFGMRRSEIEKWVETLE